MGQSILHHRLNRPEHVLQLVSKSMATSFQERRRANKARVVLYRWGHLFFSGRPWHPFHQNPICRTVHPTGHIPEEDFEHPERQILEVSRLAGIIRSIFPTTGRGHSGFPFLRGRISITSVFFPWIASIRTSPKIKDLKFSILFSTVWINIATAL